eukprot:m.9986 g.9986  ORF g.9986 m.9986 type:complete len:1091 (-) comp5511_c0_seq1:208-3480(-)
MDLATKALGPSVLVVSTSRVDEMCKANSLTLSQLLAPFSDAQHGTIRFKKPEEFAQTDYQAVAAETRALMEHYNAACEDWSLVDAQTPWYRHYRTAFLSHTKPLEHEFFNHPMSILVVLSPEQDRPGALCTSILSHPEIKRLQAKFPFLSLDRLCVGCLVLHTPQSADRVQATLSEVQAALQPQHCFAAQINSLQGKAVIEESERVPPETWINVMPHLKIKVEEQQDDGAITEDTAPLVALDDPLATPSEHVDPPTTSIGENVSVSDVQSLVKFVQQFAKGCLYASIFQEISQLSEQVAIARKSRSGILGWFGTKTQQDAQNALFRPGTPKWQTRRLADLLFMRQDYEHAYSHYHNLKKEFSSERAWLHKAATQEMMGVCQLLASTQDLRSDYSNLESAILAYTSKGDDPALAIRATWFATELLIEQRQYNEAANSFIRLVKEESAVRDALLLEQAAMCYRRLSPAHTRRAMFYLVMAAFRFNKSQHNAHAWRCFAQANRYYSPLRWGSINHHVDFMLVDNSKALGKREQALDCLTEMLRQSSDNPNIDDRALRYLKDLTGDVPADVAVPTVDQQTIRIDFNVHGTTGLKDIDSIFSKAFGKPSATFVDFMDNTTRNTVAPSALANEQIVISFTVKNHLAISLRLTNVRLNVLFEPSTQSDRDPLTLVESSKLVELTLEPNQSLSVAMSLSVAEAGSLDIQGISYNIEWNGNTLPASQPFNIKGCRLNATRPQKHSVVYSEDKRLKPRILAPFPHIKLEVNGVPHSLLSNQQVDFSVSLENTGQAEAATMFLFVSDNFEVESCSIVGSGKRVNKTSAGLFPLLTDGTQLASGQSQTLQLSTHFKRTMAEAQSLTNVSTDLVVTIAYAPASHAKLSYRTALCTFTLSVNPGPVLFASKIVSDADTQVLCLHTQLTETATPTAISFGQRMVDPSTDPMFLPSRLPEHRDTTTVVIQSRTEPDAPVSLAWQCDDSAGKTIAIPQTIPQHPFAVVRNCQTQQSSGGRRWVHRLTVECCNLTPGELVTLQLTEPSQRCLLWLGSRMQQCISTAIGNCCFEVDISSSTTTTQQLSALTLAGSVSGPIAVSPFVLHT